MGELLDNSELTLDLIHILELIDSPANYGKVLGMVLREWAIPPDKTYC